MSTIWPLFPQTIPDSSLLMSFGGAPLRDAAEVQQGVASTEDPFPASLSMLLVKHVYTYVYFSR